MVLWPDLSTEFHLELEWFQIVLSLSLLVLQEMKFWKGDKVGTNSRNSADWPNWTAKGR